MFSVLLHLERKIEFSRIVKSNRGEITLFLGIKMFQNLSIKRRIWKLKTVSIESLWV